MRILTAHVFNYRSIADLDLDFSADGIHALLGTPGAGKSSVLGAINFALYGDPGPGIDLVDVRYDKADDGALAGADVTFEHGGQTYRCVRELKRGTRAGKPIEKTAARMWRGDAELDNVTPTTMTAEVTKILGMGARAFRSANFIAQGEVDALTVATPTEVAALVEAHTGIAELTKLRDSARKEASTAAARADGLTGDPDTVADAEALETESAKALESADTDRKDAAAKAERAHEAWEGTNKVAEQLRAKERAARQAREAVVAAQALVDQAQQRTAQAEQTIRDQKLADTTVDQIDTRITDLQAQSRDLAGQGSALVSAQQTAAGLDADHKAAAEQAAAVELADLQARLEQAQTTRDGLVDQVSAARGAQQAAEAETAKLAKSVATLRDAVGDAHCPTCRQSIADVADLAADLDAQRQTAQTAAHTAAKEVTDLVAQGRAADEQIATLNQQINTANHKRAQADDLQARAQAAHQQVEQLRTGFITLVNQLANEPIDAAATVDDALEAGRDAHSAADEKNRWLQACRQTLVDAHTARTQHADAVTSLEAATAAVVDPVDPDELATAEADASAARARLDEANTNKARAESVYAAANAGHMQATNTADLARAQWDTKRKAIHDSEVQRGIASTLAALREDMLADAVSRISEAATELLQQFGGEHTAFHLDADFVPQVELPNGELRKTKLLSGGEKARAGLAFRLGIAMQATDGRLPDQIFGDEITQYLDEDGRRAIVETIGELFTAPILISHTAEIFDYASTVHQLRRDPFGPTEKAQVAA